MILHEMIVQYLEGKCSILSTFFYRSWQKLLLNCNGADTLFPSLELALFLA